MSDDFKNRKQTRLTGYDYSQNGVYFVTMCTQNRECIFGDVVDGKMVLNDWGMVAKEEWEKSSTIRQDVIPGPHVVMPNHFHGIIDIVGVGCADPKLKNHDQKSRKIIEQILQINGRAQRAPTGNTKLGAFVGGFKSVVTRRIREIQSDDLIKIWQRNYHEHIVRNDDEYGRVCEYIHSNPKNWNKDEENPA